MRVTVAPEPRRHLSELLPNHVSPPPPPPPIISPWPPSAPRNPQAELGMTHSVFMSIFCGLLLLGLIVVLYALLRALYRYVSGHHYVSGHVKSTTPTLCPTVSAQSESRPTHRWHARAPPLLTRCVWPDFLFIFLTRFAYPVRPLPPRSLTPPSHRPSVPQEIGSRPAAFSGECHAANVWCVPRSMR